MRAKKKKERCVEVECGGVVLVFGGVLSSRPASFASFSFPVLLLLLLLLCPIYRCIATAQLGEGLKV